VNGAEIGGQTLLKGGERLRLSTTVILKFALQDRLENEALETLYSDSVRDPLTGSYNKRFLMERIDHELVHASRHEGALSLMIFDLDHFKRVNDTFGHATGDAVLTETVERVRSALRAEDVLARYGGEEFVVLMRNTPLREALRIAERIRRTIEARTFLHDNNEIELTLSVGVAEFAHPVNPNASELIEMADAHLYRAKTLGRNRVEGA
jgi:diguanylate cyclase (GGDEF)-like protein